MRKNLIYLLLLSLLLTLVLTIEFAYGNVSGSLTFNSSSVKSSQFWMNFFGIIFIAIDVILVICALIFKGMSGSEKLLDILYLIFAAIGVLLVFIAGIVDFCNDITAKKTGVLIGNSIVLFFGFTWYAKVAIQNLR